MTTELDMTLDRLEQWTVPQLKRLADTLQAVLRDREAEATIEGRAGTARPACPHCGTPDATRWGMNAGLQRWRCKGCRKTFNLLTGTPLARARRRSELFAAARDMAADQPRSCRKLARELKVHRTTAWRWRMKLLKPLQGYGQQALAGLVEADETFMRESRKGSREWVQHQRHGGPQPPRPRWRDHERRGIPIPRGLSRWQIPILVLRDRHGGTHAERLPALRYQHFETVLEARLSADAILCTDSAAVYRRYGTQKQRKVEQINARKGIHVREGAYHIQNANAFHARFKEFVRPFRNPATKNLPRYVGWMVFKDGLGGGAPTGNPLAERLLA
jgi:transposase-like protein